MGNCLVLLQVAGKAEKTIKLEAVDGRALADRPPPKVHQAPPEFPGRATSGSLTVFRHLDPGGDMPGGNLCCCLAPPEAGSAEVPEAAGGGAGVVRIKLVVSRQELKAMLQKGALSLGETTIPVLESSPKIAGGRCAACWKPTLESIPEINAFF